MAIKLVRGCGEMLRWSVATAGNFANGSTAESLTSDWFQAADRYLSVQLIWTGTTLGSFTVELSNDGVNVAYTLTDTDFSPDPLSSPSGGASSTAATFVSNYVFFRVKFNRVTGSGILTGVVDMKR